MAPELLTGLAGSVSYLFAWLLPPFFAIGVFAIVVMPNSADVPPLAALQHEASDTPTRILLTTGATLFVGFILSVISTGIYRVFEGYKGSEHRRNRMLQRAKDARRIYHAEIQGGGIRAGHAKERRDLFPLDDKQILSTRLGNVMRSFEMYGHEQWGLDSQSLWEALWAVTPKQLRDEYNHARAGVDFCIAGISASGLVLLAGEVPALAEWATGHPSVAVLLGFLIGPVLAALVFYWVAVLGAVEWGNVYRGIVDVGRRPLADALGLKLPHSLKREREMWRLVSEFIPRWYPERSYELTGGIDRFRQ